MDFFEKYGVACLCMNADFAKRVAADRRFLFLPKILQGIEKDRVKGKFITDPVERKRVPSSC